MHIERGLGFDYQIDRPTFFCNPAGDRRISLVQNKDRYFGTQRSVRLSSRVGDIDGGPVWAEIMGVMRIGECYAYLTVGVPDNYNEGYVYATICYSRYGTRDGMAGGLAFGLEINASPMRKRMEKNGHYMAMLLPERINFRETVRRFIAQLNRGDYYSIPKLILPR